MTGFLTYSCPDQALLELGEDVALGALRNKDLTLNVVLQIVLELSMLLFLFIFLLFSELSL